MLPLIPVAAAWSFHCWCLYRLAGLAWPGRDGLAAGGMLLLWLAGLAVASLCVRHNRQSVPFCVLFLYGFLGLLAGMRFLPGVPQEVGQTQWRDPQGLLKPDSRYVLHNHSIVLRVLSDREYLLYITAGMLYFSFAGLGIASGIGMKALEGSRRIERRRVTHMTVFDLHNPSD